MHCFPTAESMFTYADRHFPEMCMDFGVDWLVEMYYGTIVTMEKFFTFVKIMFLFSDVPFSLNLVAFKAANCVCSELYAYCVSQLSL